MLNEFRKCRCFVEDENVYRPFLKNKTSTMFFLKMADSSHFEYLSQYYLQT